MANRNNHYEAAFEAYLRQEQIAYVAVNEQRRAIDNAGSLKSVDFIVSTNTDRWLIDVKGRRFPSGIKQKQYWRNWSTQEDLDSLLRWQQHFGQGFHAGFVFAYELTADRSPVRPEEVFVFRDVSYAFVGVHIDDYCKAARPLSPKWQTVSVPIAEFRAMARSAKDFLTGDILIGAGAQRRTPRLTPQEGLPQVDARAPRSDAVSSASA